MNAVAVIGGASIQKLRFSDVNEIREFTQEHQIVSDEIWFASEEYAEIKARSRLEVKEWRRQGFGVLLKESFELPRKDTQSYIIAFCQLEGSLSRRGLERQLSRQHGEERSDLKDRSRRAVITHQMRLLRQGLPLDEIAEQLGLLYREITRPAKIFARRMAKGDEIVAKEGESNEPAEKILEERERRNRHQMMERRLSNFSSMSGMSGTSLDSIASRRRWNSVPGKARKPPCPGSPASPVEEYYAGIA
ncbi:predicted protein [Phaeodactylum tricornutum CCAP 1055/1]|jgi:hypothetical protein|uniref:Uncharacterized protein n=2 Tax=Phaeodactylum tricornutum TaxID=2850 RepID=B7G5Y7_PHATC|nr:predicted protein [Phaeodactylum tricornutum CCAP 1055/1]EEC45917.1 predicted protein [Phaeodactylum tricornutum CCAP 1055/1]|mmetsp:Transcript_20911/g.53159  ORF Transcript_20911/g.53159 Transcript_20911/m.53159 type:complete len:248 (+) Transcript_20911:263-1006(+)|eukprot:XP_002182630.1 predicted protein [Phaeodactylum tricornutum CCAP 1055/1]